MADPADPRAADPRAADRCADELAIRGLVARYCMLVDDGRWDDFAGLWAEGGRMHVMGTTHTGRAAVRDFLCAAMPPEVRGRHATSSQVVTFDDEERGGGDRARGWVDFMFFDASGAATRIGRYHDEYVRGGDGEWRLALREIVFLGGEPELTGPLTAG